MVKLSNNLLGILNVISLLISIPIIAGGVWLSRQSNTDCERYFEKPVIAVGVILLLFSLAGVIGACCRVSWLLWIYLAGVFVLIVVLFGFTIFAFVVTNKGAGEAISGRGYKEYRFGDYSHWLQKKVDHNWGRIRSCLEDSKICQKLIDDANNNKIVADIFYKQHLSALQSGCCKPSNDCNFTYVSPTNWIKMGQPIRPNTDCDLWGNDPNRLCYSCQSCKAGLIDNIKSNWKKVAKLNIAFLVILVVVYSVGCCAFRNNREERHRSSWKP
ncbi:unnamed protein product [Cuscuta campestris]|uniref:Tetraspanin n=1 Tax=Cuscuta campestris TaxID=132261 RepID=A0A484N401_9ASTE|nr:unnamed protein product [Cuscuta campestris]